MILGNKKSYDHNKGKRNPMYGRKQTPEAKKKMSDEAKQRTGSKNNQSNEMNKVILTLP